MARIRSARNIFNSASGAMVSYVKICHKKATIVKNERTAHQMCAFCKREENHTSVTFCSIRQVSGCARLFIVYEIVTSSKGLSSAQVDKFTIGVKQKDKKGR